MRLEEYIHEAISSGKHSKDISSIITRKKFHMLLLDNLFLGYEMSEFPGDNPSSTMTKNEGLFFRILNHNQGDIESYAKKEYPDGIVKYYVNVPTRLTSKNLVWYVAFDGGRLISAELYSYYNGKSFLETDGIEAISDLVEYLKLGDFKKKEKWLALNA